MPGDEALPESEGCGTPRARTGPRHAVPRKSLLTRVHVPAGKAIALAAMPTAVLMGMGLTPRLAQAAEPKSTFTGDHCVSQSDSPSPSDSPSASPSASASPSPSAKEKPKSGSSDKSGTAAKKSAKPTPSPSSSSANRSSADPSGLGSVLGGLLGGLTGSGSGASGSTTPKPTTTPTPSAKPTPSASHKTADGGALGSVAKTVNGVTQSVTGATKGLTGAAKNVVGGATGSSSSSDHPYPCPTYNAKALADAGLEQTPSLLPDQPWILKSSMLTLTGLKYDGIVKVETENGTVKKVLKFTASGVDIKDLHQIVQGPAGSQQNVQAAAGSTSTIRNGTVTMYTQELKGNLLGLIPIDFTPDSPPPVTTPAIFFTDVTVTQAGQFGGTLTVPGMHAYGTP